MRKNHGNHRAVCFRLHKHWLAWPRGQQAIFTTKPRNFRLLQFGRFLRRVACACLLFIKFGESARAGALLNEKCVCVCVFLLLQISTWFTHSTILGNNIFLYFASCFQIGILPVRNANAVFRLTECANNTVHVF